jgi:hypothetical protein
MRRLNPIIVLLVVASLLADWCVATIAHPEQWPSVASVLLAALLTSQTNLLAVWTALGAGKWWIRIPVTAAAIVCLDYLSVGPHSTTDAQVRTLEFFGFQALVVVGLFSLLRPLGWRLSCPSSEPEAADNPKRPGQFSIRDILLATTAWAVFGAVVTRVPGIASLTFVSASTVSAAIFVMPMPAIVIAVLCQIPWVMRSLLLIVPSGASLFLARTMLMASPSYTYRLLTTQLLVAATLLCVRSAGNRLLRTQALQRSPT